MKKKILLSVILLSVFMIFSGCDDKDDNENEKIVDSNEDFSSEVVVNNENDTSEEDNKEDAKSTYQEVVKNVFDVTSAFDGYFEEHSDAWCQKIFIDKEMVAIKSDGKIKLFNCNFDQEKLPSKEVFSNYQYSYITENKKGILLFNEGTHQEENCYFSFYDTDSKKGYDDVEVTMEGKKVYQSEVIDCLSSDKVNFHFEVLDEDNKNTNSFIYEYSIDTKKKELICQLDYKSTKEMGGLFMNDMSKYEDNLAFVGCDKYGFIDTKTKDIDYKEMFCRYKSCVSGVFIIEDEPKVKLRKYPKSIFYLSTKDKNTKEIKFASEEESSSDFIVSDNGRYIAFNHETERNNQGKVVNDIVINVYDTSNGKQIAKYNFNNIDNGSEFVSSISETKKCFYYQTYDSNKGRKVYKINF